MGERGEAPFIEIGREFTSAFYLKAGVMANALQEAEEKGKKNAAPRSRLAAEGLLFPPERPLYRPLGFNTQAYYVEFFHTRAAAPANIAFGILKNASTRATFGMPRWKARLNRRPDLPIDNRSGFFEL
ncbi:MAG: hypothetical protein JWL59_468 [Chthoniobacteraceae bacterium]|nr:hypothetical protein [Chthoniobacteraceae bacterium]